MGSKSNCCSVGVGARRGRALVGFDLNFLFRIQPSHCLMVARLLMSAKVSFRFGVRPAPIGAGRRHHDSTSCVGAAVALTAFGSAKPSPARDPGRSERAARPGRVWRHGVTGELDLSRLNAGGISNHSGGNGSPPRSPRGRDRDSGLTGSVELGSLFTIPHHSARFQTGHRAGRRPTFFGYSRGHDHWPRQARSRRRANSVWRLQRRQAHGVPDA